MAKRKAKETIARSMKIPRRPKKRIPQLHPIWLIILMALAIMVLGAQIYFLDEENEALTKLNDKLASVIFEKPVANKLYIFGCKSPAAAVIVFSNGSSRSVEWEDLKKIKKTIPKDIEILTYQAPDCRPSKT